MAVEKCSVERSSVQCRHCGLHGVCCEAGLYEDDASRIDALVTRREPVSAGESLIRRGEVADSLFAVKSGVFISSATGPEGERRIVELHFPGELFGLDALAAGRYRHTVEASVDGSVCRLHLSQVDRMPNESRPFQQHLIRAFSQRLRQAYWMPLMMGAQSAEQRAATFLLSIFERLSQRAMPARQFRLPLSRREIADYLGVAVETVSRMFQRMQQLNVLEVSGRQITLCDIDRLRRIARLEGAVAG